MNLVECYGSWRISGATIVEMVGIDEGRDREVAVTNASLIWLVRITTRPLGWLELVGPGYGAGSKAIDQFTLNP